MPQSDFMSPDELMVEIYRAIYAALESRFKFIGGVIDADYRKEILTSRSTIKAISTETQVT